MALEKVVGHGHLSRCSKKLCPTILLAVMNRNLGCRSFRLALSRTFRRLLARIGVGGDALQIFIHSLGEGVNAGY